MNAISCAANYAWVNRSSMLFLARQAFAKMFKTTPDELDMHVIYDMSHNIAKYEGHKVNGVSRTCCSTATASRGHSPHHPLIAVDHQVPPPIDPHALAFPKTGTQICAGHHSIGASYPSHMHLFSPFFSLKSGRDLG